MHLLSTYKKAEKLTLMGHLLKDPKIRQIEGNFYMLLFSLKAGIALDNSKDIYGEEKTYHIILWRHMGDLALRALKKGSLVYLEGHIISNGFKDSGQRQITELAGSELLLLSN
jgi:single-strand DNA-binding protein